MKKRWMLAMVLAISLLAGCGAAGGNTSMSAADAAESTTMEAPGAEPGAFDTGGGTVPERKDRGEKLIYTAELQMETTAFDEAAEAIRDLTADSGGYFQSSSVSSWGSGYRSARYTIRVPAEAYAAFLEQVGALCHVLDRQEYTDNVTEAYYDTDGRLKTQQTKLERLQALLAKAETMEDIITIESAISETEAQIESLAGELRHYDALVDYATVTISLEEVYKLSNVEEPATGFFSRLGSAFVSGFQGFLNGLEDLAVALAYGWTWLVILALIAVLVVRRLRKRRKDVQKPDDKQV